MPLFEQFRQFADDHSLFHPGERVLLSVSGGVDSVVMAHLFLRAKVAVGIGHCNYQLRGAASDGDEDFVRDLAEQFGVPAHVAVFDTRAEAERQGWSIQMAARELRYDWLEEMRRAEGYDRIATAHQLDDSVETFFYNFAKGAGLRGLHGIPIRRGAIIRPLLFATKTEIRAYAEGHHLGFREDASNAFDVYARNKIRLQAIPVFRDLNPAFDTTAAANLERLREAEYLYDLALERIRAEVLRLEGERTWIDIDRLLFHYRAASTILFELLRPFGFLSAQIPQILENTGRQPGARFFSETHCLLIDRENLVVEPRVIDSEEKVYYLAEQIDTVYLPDGHVSFRWQEGRPASFSRDPYRVEIDAGLLEFPLRFRRWRPGDFFHPLGMSGQRQKLQDFFTNQKVLRTDKDRIWLLENGDGAICWVVGHRIDERFKITPATVRYVEMTFQPA